MIQSGIPFRNARVVTYGRLTEILDAHLTLTETFELRSDDQLYVNLFLVLIPKFTLYSQEHSGKDSLKETRLNLMVSMHISAGHRRRPKRLSCL